MPNTEKFTYPSIQKILVHPELSATQKIEKLKLQLEDERAVQRAASESNMIEEEGQGSRMRELEIALDALDAEVTSCQDTKAATL